MINQLLNIIFIFK